MNVLVMQSGNAKTGPTAATYLPLTTCPTSCAMRGSGCYAELGNVRLHANRRALTMTAREAASREAIEIAAARPPVGRALRLHVSGDVPDAGSALRVAIAARLWRANGGGPVWTYTHRWREIPRRAWGDSISVLASCETDADELNARARGYAVARVIEQLPADGRATEAGIPCPAQMRAGVQCATCRLCWSDPQRTILFGAHGVSSERVRRKLRVLGG